MSPFESISKSLILPIFGLSFIITSFSITLSSLNFSLANNFAFVALINKSPFHSVKESPL